MKKIPMAPLVLVMLLLFPLLSCTYLKTVIHEYTALVIRTLKWKCVVLSVLFQTWGIIEFIANCLAL